jgi:type II secretory pathway component HofQ
LTHLINQNIDKGYTISQSERIAKEIINNFNQQYANVNFEVNNTYIYYDFPQPPKTEWRDTFLSQQPGVTSFENNNLYNYSKPSNCLSSVRTLIKSFFK